MTMEKCQQSVAHLEKKVRARDGVRDVALIHDKNSGLNRNNAIIDRPVFQVKLLPAQKDDMGKASFQDFFWKEAHKLDLSTEIISLVIDEKEDPTWDPPI